MGERSRYSAEVREPAVRLVWEHATHATRPSFNVSTQRRRASRCDRSGGV